jgi:hypothetical protein
MTRREQLTAIEALNRASRAALAARLAGNTDAADRHQADADTARRRLGRLTPSRPRGPSCGHPACSQHYIDTGSSACVAAWWRR